MINRRNFVKQSFLVAGLTATAGWQELLAAPAVHRLTILHTNDVHSRLDPFPMDGGRNQGQGGVAARMKLIEQIRKEVPHVLLLDAGDIFQGTPYFNLYKGEPEILAMKKMGYDAATIGNHDFDAGMENLLTQMKKGGFAFLNANYDFTNTPLENQLAPYTILKKGDIQIGIFGVGIELAGLVPENLYGSTIYQDPIPIAKNISYALRKKGCDLVICLSHLGYDFRDQPNKISDKVLATETSHIDVIIGGHTHTFLPEPQRFTNKAGGITYVNQVGWGGLQLGRLDFIFERDKRKNLLKSHTVVISENNTQ